MNVMMLTEAQEISNILPKCLLNENELPNDWILCNVAGNFILESSY